MVETSALKSQMKSSNDSWMLSERNIYICHDIGNIPDNSDEWLHTFVDFLSVFLNRISKAKYNIYFSGIKHVNLKNVVENTNVFIFVLKSDTLQSSAFAEEIKLIQTRCWDNEKKVLLLKILASPISEAAQPSFLSGISGFHFFDSKAPVNSRLSLWMNEKIFTSKVILEQLADLVYQTESFFGKIMETKVSDIPKSVVYLAETTADQVYNREILKRELEEYGFKVLPNRQLPQVAEEFQATVKSYLEQSSFSIHIIGGDYGEIPKGEVHSSIDIQNKMAAEWAKNSMNTSKLFSRLIWVAPNAQITNDLQKHYIENLKHNGEELINAEIIQSPLEDFKSLIIKRIKMATQVNNNPQKNEIKVYIIHEETDIESVKNIATWLQSNGIATVCSEFNSTKNLFAQHRQYLVESEAVLIYNSNHNPTWLSSKITDCMKAPGYGKKNPFLAKLVLMTQNTDGISMNVLRDFTQLSIRDNITDTLQPLLNLLISKTN
jgi:hypothetical protein